MKKLDTYLDLCTLYYDLDKPEPPKDDFDFYLEYIKNSDGPILEPMCGTGRFLVPYLKLGYEIKGFDASNSMLHKLKQKISDQEFSSHVWQGFIQDLSSKEKFKLIFIPSGSFGLITDLSDIKRSLEKIYDHLAEDGIFVFEVETLEAVPKQFNIWRGDVREMEEGRFIIASFFDLPLKNNIGTSFGKYELIEGNQVVQAQVEKYAIRYYTQQELDSLLKSIGFHHIKFIKAFEHSREPDERDEVFICECRK